MLIHIYICSILLIIMIIQTNWCVITGGPASGKTKIIEYLTFLGYPVIQELARILIAVEKSKGKTTEEIRSDEAEFQKKLLKMKTELEDRILPNQLTFFDRGIPDSIAYYKLCKVDPKEAIEASKKRRYKVVFLLDQVLISFENDGYRIETNKLANELN